MTAEKCVARQVSDQMVCAACGLRWDVNDPEPPPCDRKDRLPNGEVRLTQAETRALRMARESWLTRRRGGYRSPDHGLVRLATARRLLGMQLLMIGPRGGLRTTYKGERWLDRNGKEAM